MGNFSWCTSDTEKSIPCVYETYEGAPTTIYLLNPFGEPYKETDYEGYGVFGGRDVYELVVEWNRKYLTADNLSKPKRSDWAADKEGTACYKRQLERYDAKCAAIKEYAAGATDEYMREHYGALFGYGDGFDWKRCLGIDIACYDEQHVKLRYPIKIVEEVCDYEDAFISPSCPFQGCFYDGNYKSISAAVNECFDKLLEVEKAFADEKANVLEEAFSCMKLDYAYVAETYPHMIVRDDEDNTWTDCEIYDFVLNECLGFEPDGSLQFGFGAVSQELADKLKSHAATYGVLPEISQKSIDKQIAKAVSVKEEAKQNTEKNLNVKQER